MDVNSESFSGSFHGALPFLWIRNRLRENFSQEQADDLAGVLAEVFF